MALQHPLLLPHVKEKQIGLLNSCQAKWGCTENKQKGNWIRGRVHATLNRSTDLRLSLCNWTKDFEDEFWGGGSWSLGKNGQATCAAPAGCHSSSSIAGSADVKVPLLFQAAGCISPAHPFSVWIESIPRLSLAYLPQGRCLHPDFPRCQS